MRGFVLGILFTLIVLAVGIDWYAKTGHVNFEADQQPSNFERRFAMSAVDASTDRRARDMKNAVPANEENVVAGAQIYLHHCAGCHGTPSNPDSQFASSFNPPVPQFFKRAPDMPDYKNFYIVQHGTRWTGMPAWEKTLSEREMWQVVTFLGHVDKLSPAAKRVFDQGAAPSPLKTPR
jgi:mono/diheme cytochrome c family protein